jgi:hypothetical protein
MSEGFKAPNPHESLTPASDFDGLGAEVVADPMREQGAYVLKFPQEGAVSTIRIVLNDYSGADLVITNMTTLPHDQTSKGFGSDAVQKVLVWAETRGMKDIRAVQVQRQSEGFWERNGFSKMKDPNPTNDFIHFLIA